METINEIRNRINDKKVDNKLLIYKSIVSFIFVKEILVWKTLLINDAFASFLA